MHLNIEQKISLIVIFTIILVTLILFSGCNPSKFAASIFDKPNINTSEQKPAPSVAKQLYDTAKKANWMTTLAIPIIALGAVAIFNGAAKIGMSAIIFGTVSLFMALATARFAFNMAIIGLIGSVAAVAFSILIKNKALKDVITNVQVIKAKAKSDNIDSVFQDKIKDVLKEQAGTTKKLINKVKSKLNFNSEESK